MGCHSLLQGIFPTQGSNLGLPRCRWILYCLSHQGSLHWDMWNNLLKAYFLGFIYWENLYQIGYRILNRMLLVLWLWDHRSISKYFTSYFTSSNRLFGQLRQVEVKGQLHYSSRRKKMRVASFWVARTSVQTEIPGLGWWFPEGFTRLY